MEQNKNKIIIDYDKTGQGQVKLVAARVVTSTLEIEGLVVAESEEENGGTYITVYGHEVETKEKEIPYIDIKWQEGTEKENGKNGVQITDVLQIALDKLNEFQKAVPCKENEHSILMIEQAILHQSNRTRNRTVRGVEGTHEE